MEETPKKPNWWVSVVAWFSMLIASSVGIIILKEFEISYPPWYPWLHVGALGIVLIFSIFIKILHPLRLYIVILLILFLLGFGGGWDWGLIPYIRDTQIWIDWETNSSWIVASLGIHSLRLVPAVFILITLLITGKKPRDFYLVVGDIRAQVEPTIIIGMKKPDSWPKIGLIFAGIFTLGTLIFSIIVNPIPWVQFRTNWLYLPVAILIAAMNAFNEEFSLRAAPLSQLFDTLGKTQSLLITSIFFGIGHFYGVPNGVVGILLSTFLGWFIGKSLIETKGFFWAWLIHFLPDVIIFSFYALSA
ncbi:MAG: CPBP family intramembrane metalloprotease [Promethearchaeota archaeon]|nr:MAG: CPBP family intramembrane metalloprotease [Candidatus Lokiarchaeota archaeon]